MQLGLIGYPLSHSFSRKYFSEKFARKGLAGYSYENFPLKEIGEFPNLLRDRPDLRGLNVTIPYKQSVIEYLDQLDPEAAAIEAVNTIVVKNQSLKGYNTDIYGFQESLSRFIPEDFTSGALVLGTGGAAKAVCYALTQLDIPYVAVSRTVSEFAIPYDQITTDLMSKHKLIVNTTPLGMHPHVDMAPDIPYHNVEPGYFLYDLIYNPQKTLFLARGQQRGAEVKNGLEMLELQAEKSWAIWTKENHGSA